MRKWLVLATLSAAALSLSANETLEDLELEGQEMVEIQPIPEYLFKILSVQNWQQSQMSEAIALSAEDGAFIHLATRDQVEKILEKYWADVPQFVVLKVDTHQLRGRMAYETNPGGVTKYFHLYDGSIPSSAVVDYKYVDRTSNAVR